MSTQRQRKAHTLRQGRTVEQPTSPPAPLSPEKQRSLTTARQAIATIEQLVSEQQQRFSQKREHALLTAYHRLSCQSGTLGIGITPFHEDERHDLKRLLAIILNFKGRLEGRYGQYESAQEQKEKFMNPSTSFIQAGAVLLATALRDPAPIVSDATTWGFIKVTDAFFVHLTEEERNGEAFMMLMDKKQTIATTFVRDMTPVPEQHAFRFGPELIEAIACYVEQAAIVMAKLLEQRANDAHFAEHLQQFEAIMASLKNDIAEVPPQGDAVREALAAFLACQQSESSAAVTASNVAGEISHAV